MKLSELLKQDKIMLSFEVFPPKTSTAFESVKNALAKAKQFVFDRLEAAKQDKICNIYDMASNSYKLLGKKVVFVPKHKAKGIKANRLISKICFKFKLCILLKMDVVHLMLLVEMERFMMIIVLIT